MKKLSTSPACHYVSIDAPKYSVPPFSIIFTALYPTRSFEEPPTVKNGHLEAFLGASPAGNEHHLEVEHHSAHIQAT
jgi:hypothetical protein